MSDFVHNWHFKKKRVELKNKYRDQATKDSTRRCANERANESRPKRTNYHKDRRMRKKERKKKSRSHYSPIDGSAPGPSPDRPYNERYKLGLPYGCSEGGWDVTKQWRISAVGTRLI